MSADNPASPGRMRPLSSPPPNLQPLSKSSSGGSGFQNPRLAPGDRLVSLDAFRGLVMIVLAASGFGILAMANRPEDHPAWQQLDRDFWQALKVHVDHPPWLSSFQPGSAPDGSAGHPLTRVWVSLWDLIQPAFMFMVGAAMPFSYRRREHDGHTFSMRTVHALVRSVVLVLMGVFLYSIGKPSTNWVFTNVLAQIGLGYFFVYLLMPGGVKLQLPALVFVLAWTWWMYDRYSPADYVPEQVAANAARGEVLDPPKRQWSKNGNLAHAVDVRLLNSFPRPNGEQFVFEKGGYHTLNFLPSIATMLLGVLCGQVLVSRWSPGSKLSVLLFAAAACLVLGVAGGAYACPVIKRIWTPSWALLSGGYVIAFLAACYATFDMSKRLQWLAFPLQVVGMNSLVMYLLGQTVRGWTGEHVVRTHFRGPLEAIIGGGNYDLYQPMIENTGAMLVFWLVLYWMYRQQFFVKV